MKSIHKWLLALALLWAPLVGPAVFAASPQAAPALAQAPVADFTRGLLWKVERSGIRPSYLFGTVHSEDPRVLDVPAAVQQAFDGADSFAMEVLLDDGAVQQMAGRMFLPIRQDLRTLLGQALFARTSSLMQEYGTPPEVVLRMKPWVVFTTLSLPRAETGLFLDRVLQANAAQQGKRVYGLETIDEQLSVFDEIALQDQIALLAEAVENHAQLKRDLQQVIERYLARDLAGMKQLSDEESDRLGNPRLVAEVERRLIYERNARMVERMMPRLQEGNAFVAIGSLHLPGEQGVLRRLQQRGYSISAVY